MEIDLWKVIHSIDSTKALVNEFGFGEEEDIAISYYVDMLIANISQLYFENTSAVPRIDEYFYWLLGDKNKKEWDCLIKKKVKEAVQNVTKEK